ncbi:hypothetical protein [Tissierella praeacuta]|uniref:hypothetical protein n=1 Tax=Tissierella praeacuta TaxID=43131 RepID=UPI003DA540A0
MSKILNRITGNTMRMNDGVAKAQQTMNRRTEFARNLSRDEQALELLGARYVNQSRTVERLRREYEKSIGIKGKYHEATARIERKLLDAQMAEMKMADAVEKAGKKLEEQNNRMRNNIDASGNFTNKIKGLVGAYLGIRGIKKGFDSTVMAAAELNQQAAVMQAAFGNKDIGRGYFNRLRVYAIDTRQDIEALTDVTKNFMQLTKNTDKLMGLTNIANKLSMRTGNIGSAESLMQEAMRGQYSRLQRSLHLTDSQIAPLKKAVQRGSLDGIIGAFNQALNTAGLTDEIVQAYQNSPLQKFYKISDRIKMNLARTGEEALARMEPALDKINTWLQSSNADKFFGAISTGVSMTVNGIIWLTEAIYNNWDIIRPILIAIGAIYLTNIITKLQAVIELVLKQGIVWMATHWPIMATLGIILILIKVLIQSGVTAGQITGFIAGVFATLWVTLHNGLAFTWNRFASFAEFLVNLFIDKTYAIKMLFYNLAMDVLGFFNNMLHGIVSGLNWIVEKINEKLGTNLGTVQLDFMDRAILELEKHKPTTDKNVWQAPRMEYKDYAKEISKAYNWGDQLPDRFKAGLGSIEDAINNFANQESIWNAGQNDTLGKIDDNTKSLKKTEEDLKWMRDLAEQETINRFTTATMAPQISIAFGDVRETADVDGIVAHIENILTEQINIAAEGVHN